MVEQTRNSLAALAISPIETFMEAQDEGEEVKILIRRHPITNLGWILVTLIALIIPIIVFSDAGITFLGLESILEMFSAKAKQGFVLMWYLWLFLFAVQNALLWFFNVLIVTNERLVDLDVSWPFHRFVTETRISQVQDVSFSQGGFISSIFNYGGVYIQTAGVEQNIELTRAPKPAQIHDRITDLVQKYGGHLRSASDGDQPSTPDTQ